MEDAAADSGRAMACLDATNRDTECLLHLLENRIAVEQPYESDKNVQKTNDHEEHTRSDVDELEHSHQEEQEGEKSQQQALGSIAVRNALVVTAAPHHSRRSREQACKPRSRESP